MQNPFHPVIPLKRLDFGCLLVAEFSVYNVIPVTNTKCASHFKQGIISFIQPYRFSSWTGSAPTHWSLVLGHYLKK